MKSDQLDKIDELIVEKVMGFQRDDYEDVPRYSSNLIDAWTVVDKINMFGDWSDDIWTGPMELYHSNGLWSISYQKNSSMGGDPHQIELVKNIESTPLAICLAVLKIMKIEDKDWK